MGTPLCLNRGASPLVIMSLGLLPLALTELLLHTAIGRRRMEAQVIVRELTTGKSSPQRCGLMPNPLPFGKHPSGGDVTGAAHL
jgi:hypothetical protein